MATKLELKPKWLTYIEVIDKRKKMMIHIWENGLKVLHSKLEEITSIACTAIAKVEKCYVVLEYEGEDEKYVAVQTLEATTTWDGITVQIKCHDVNEQLRESYERVLNGKDEGDFFVNKSGDRDSVEKESEYDSIENQT